MDPMMALISQGANIAATGAGIIGQSQARADAKSAANEQRRQDAYYALMAAAGGGAPGRPSQIAPAPGVNWGGALANVGANIGQYGTIKQENADNQFLQNYRTDLLATRMPKGSVSPKLGVVGTGSATTRPALSQDAAAKIVYAGPLSGYEYPDSYKSMVANLYGLPVPAPAASEIPVLGGVTGYK